MGEQQTARADETSDATVYVVSYLEVMPPSTAEAAALLRQYRDVSRTDTGHVRLEVLQQSGRPDHFAIVEMWQDQKAFEAHGSAVHTRAFHERLRPLRVSPYDERLHTCLAMAATRAAHAAGVTYVVTHADAIPSGKDDAITLLKRLVEASRNDGGGIGFEVLQQRSRQNHFTIVEIWQGQQTFEAHAMTVHTRQFRDQFQPLSGSLYDERLYQALD
ncbi:MAG: putative quinol monooxygenase [Candidatus Entotheonellia bacterium]